MNSLSLWRSWIVANALGELIGLGVVFGVGFAIAQRISEPHSTGVFIATGVLIALLAAFEGGVVGAFQWLVLRKKYEEISLPSWVIATVIGAVIAWLLGMLPSAVMNRNDAVQSEPPLALMMLAGAAIGVVAGLILSTAQWRVLRRHAPSAWIWLPANALAWAVAMPLIFASIDFVDMRADALATVAALSAAIAVIGAIVGTINGAFLVLLRRRET